MRKAIPKPPRERVSSSRLRDLGLLTAALPAPETGPLFSFLVKEERTKPMEVMDAIRKRRSVRSFKPDPLTKEQVKVLVEAMGRAPTAGNLHSRKFFLVSNPRIIAALARAALGQAYMEQAPLVVVACSDLEIFGHYGKRGVELYGLQEVAASVENLMLAATDLGLATVWVGAFKEEQVSQALELPEYLRPVAMVPVGHPESIPEARKDFDPEQYVVRVE